MSNEINTEVIILAQGPTVGGMGARAWHRLPACARTPIITRTVAQVLVTTNWWPTVVTHSGYRCDAHFSEKGRKTTVYPAYVELPFPGNSALKGIARYLERRAEQGRRYDRTIVLLGDVVYSWACIDALVQRSKHFGFVGTGDLSEERGDLRGASWHRDHEDFMMSALRDALLRCNPFDDDAHERRQFRRWVSGIQRGEMASHVDWLRRRGHYVDIDDYTHDLDDLQDMVLLPELSRAAADDDAKREVHWAPP